MAILVTGGAGFIGSNLLDRLAARGEDLVCWDDFNDFYDPRVKRANIAPLLAAGRVRLYEGDIGDAALGQDIFRRERIETVIHLAARAGVRPSLHDPLLYERVNVGGVTAVLELARRHGVKNFVFGSSSSVYGNNAKLPFSEADPVEAPISPYAATKRAGELLCRCYHELYGMRVACLRLFTVYGPRGRPDLAIYLFTERMFRGEEITVFGDGESRRDFTFVQDIVDGIIAAADRALPFEIINLGESATVSVNELVALIARATGCSPRLRTLPAQPGDVKATYADISKARRLLGYAPSFPIERGIPAFVEWYRRTILDRRG